MSSSSDTENRPPSSAPGPPDAEAPPSQDGVSAGRPLESLSDDGEEELPLPDDYEPDAVSPSPAGEPSAPAHDGAGREEPPPARLPAPGSAAAPDPSSGGGAPPDRPPPGGTSRTPGNSAAPRKADAGGEPMSLLGHLGELRRRLLRVVIIIMLGFVACYGLSEALYDFLSAPLMAAMPEGSTLIYTSPAGAFFVYLKVSLLASLFLTSPFSFYQIWAFIGPGLYQEEKRVLVPLALLSAFFFLIGAVFCYAMVFPLAFRFFMGLATDTIVPMISVEEYLSFVLKLLIAFGVVFEMPLFAFFLGRLGILTPDFMRSKRKYAVLLVFIVAAILTPPDVYSQLLMAVPMLLLYEVSIYVAGWSRRWAKREGKKEAPGGKAADPQGEPHGDAQKRP